MNFKWKEIVSKFIPNHLKLLELIPQHQNSSSSLGINFRLSTSPRDRSIIEAFLVNQILKEQKMEGSAGNSQNKILKIFTVLEMPMQKVLANMEINGFPVNPEKLHEMIENCVVLRKKLQDYIYKLNGREFDINSKSQVAKVVGIHQENGRKISTAKNVLAKIDSPIASCIATYRTLSTTISNLQPMTKIIQKGRVHASSYSLTQTGRISMFEPNLQNVTNDFTVEFEGE